MAKTKSKTKSKKKTLSLHNPPRLWSLPFLLVLLFLLFVNSYFFFFSSDPLLAAKRDYYSFSVGSHYYGLLELWSYYAQKGDWSVADKLALNIDPADIQSYIYNHHPSELKKRYNQLVVKSNKTTDDLLELSKIQVSLDRSGDAVNTLKSAREIDPIRADLEKLYYQLLQAK